MLEIGFGSGLNTAHYPAAVTGVTAIEPSDLAWKLAADRLAATTIPIARSGLDGEKLPLPDDSCDTALSTWTLCTIPDVTAALDEVRRVLKPGGTFHFVEHGLAPDDKVQRWQHRLEPIQKRLFGGCHLTRPITTCSPTPASPSASSTSSTRTAHRSSWPLTLSGSPQPLQSSDRQAGVHTRRATGRRSRRIRRAARPEPARAVRPAKVSPWIAPNTARTSSSPSTVEWAPTDTPGFWEKPLLVNVDGGTTTLMRVDPGAHAELHHHDQLEEIFVLEGEFSDQHRTYGPGEYCVRAPGAEHTSHSVDGCTVLLVYRP